MIKDGLEVVKRRNLNYIIEEGRVKKEKPWLGDLFSFAYDFLMDRFVIPRQLGGDPDRHLQIMKRELAGLRGKDVLELAAGTGSAAGFLDSSNSYVGTDISPGLLRKGVRRFASAGFEGAEFYVCGSDELPFEDNLFDMVLCVLALNFFPNLELVLSEVKRVLKEDGRIVCCVPVSDRLKSGKRIEGNLYSEASLERIFTASGLDFQAFPAKNGSIFYFGAAVKD